jgi:hypothetical protein
MSRRTRKAKPLVSNGMVIPKAVDTIRDLAAVLHEHFKGQLSCAIDATLVGKWRRGIGLGQVVLDGEMVRPPNPPPRGKGNHFHPAEWVAWVNQWIVPQKQVNGRSIAGSAEDFEDIEKKHAIWKMKRERDISDGEYASRTIFNQHVVAIGLAINRGVNASEKQMQHTIVSAVKAKLPDDQLLPVITQAINDGIQAAADGLREAIVKALGEAHLHKPTKRSASHQSSDRNSNS